MIVNNVTRGVQIGDRIEVADTSQKRRRGLLKHTSLAEGEGLWIVPCEGVHTIGMKFAIDVVFLSKQRNVLKIRRDMGKWKFAMCLRAHSVLELPAGRAGATGLSVGDQLELLR